EKVLNVQTKMIYKTRVQSENKARKEAHTRNFDRIKIKEKKDQRNSLTLTDCFYDWCKSVPLPRSTL
ncbi:MAG: hypothetical protein ACFFCQ_09965, partial [Promethearchaeota archaeon]